MMLGQPLAGIAPSYPVGTAWPDQQSDIVSTGDPCFSAGQWNAVFQAGGAGASGPWYGASRPAAFPFVLNQPRTLYQLGWMNGSAAGDNWDVGVYDANLDLIVSTGSTAGSGNSTFQFVNISDTNLSPGRYYLAAVLDATTANRVNFIDATTQPGQPVNAAIGTLDTASSQFPLPNPLASMVAAATITDVPILLMAFRSLV